jgi:hypothetical protein
MSTVVAMPPVKSEENNTPRTPPAAATHRTFIVPPKSLRPA